LVANLKGVRVRQGQKFPEKLLAEKEDFQ